MAEEHTSSTPGNGVLRSANSRAGDLVPVRGSIVQARPGAAGRPDGRRQVQNPALIQERKLQALDLRKAGLSYRQIGEELNVSYQTAWQDVRAAMKALAQVENGRADEVRRIELQRLDELWRGLWADATGGDPAAIRAALGLMERRAKLLGLDAPAKTEHSGNVSFVELASMLDDPNALDQQSATDLGDDEDE